VAREEGEYKIMNIEIRELSQDFAKFVLEDAQPASANALRRSLISEVPSLAIDDVKIYENSSVLFDEMLAHRLGLVPLKAPVDEFVLPEECSCDGEGCSACMTSATLSSDGEGVVYSGDLNTEDVVEVVDEDIPLAKLGEGQEIKLEAIARMGKGKEHSKWQPTVGCSYKTYPVIDISDECTECGECVEVCPRGVYEVNDGEPVIANVEDCSLCSLCVEQCHAEAIQVYDDNSKFIFRFEVDGSVPPRSVIEQAIEIIVGKLEDFRDSV